MQTPQKGFVGILIVIIVATTLVFLVSYSLGRHNPRDPHIEDKQKANIQIQ
ncbi:MAG: hypothetical protein RJB39_467 [Candidatus Parcubacteria bacterium]|jgi:hypothetical protein